MSSNTTTLKVVLIGDGGVGKSSLMNRFITGNYDGESYHTIDGIEFKLLIFLSNLTNIYHLEIPGIPQGVCIYAPVWKTLLQMNSVEFLNKTLNVEGKNYTLQIWDTAGQERFKSLRTPFYRGADCCLLVFALNDAKSFTNLQLWKSEFLFYANIDDERFPFIILGNKNDIELADREVEEDQIKKWCKENGGYTYIETSAKDATNVNYCFECAVRNTMLNQSKKGEASFSNISSEAPTVNLKTMAAANKKSGCC